MLAVPVGDHVRRRAAVSTTVTSRASAGSSWPASSCSTEPATCRAAACRSRSARPPRGRCGTSPRAIAGDGVTERIHVYNPSAREARVEIDVLLDQGEADPVELTVPASRA